MKEHCCYCLLLSFHEVAHELIDISCGSTKASNYEIMLLLTYAVFDQDLLLCTSYATQQFDNLQDSGRTKPLIYDIELGNENWKGYL